MTHADKLPEALIVAGPTCSGKSALALALAERLGGTIINADSMQVYRELRVLTARPAPEEEGRVPHRLYGIRQAADAANAAWWRERALTEMSAAREAGSLPILCGGTGMYMSSLTRGIVEVPEISEASRAEARKMLAELGPSAMHAALATVDRSTAARLKPNDSQRVARAWEVWRETGRGLAAWQKDAPPLPDWSFRMILLQPPRDELRDAIARRTAGMLAAGAIDEVRALVAQNLDPALPAMRAHGVPELSAYLRGDIDIKEAAGRITLVTSQYAKRQDTWFRHRDIVDADRAHTIHARVMGLTQFSEREWGDLVNFTQGKG